MNIAVNSLVDKVKVCIDEIALNDAEFVSGQDNTEMNTIIRSKITEAVRFILSKADWGLIEPDTVITNETPGSGFSLDSNLVGRIPLPDNFLRLCYARFDSWPYYPNEYVGWNDKEYASLNDAYVGGSWERPKIGFVMTPKKTIELYKAKEHGEGWSVGIITEPDADGYEDGNGNVAIPERLIPAVVYYIAGLTLLTYKDSHADSMFNQALALAAVRIENKD